VTKNVNYKLSYLKLFQWRDLSACFNHWFNIGNKWIDNLFFATLVGWNWNIPNHSISQIIFNLNSWPLVKTWIKQNNLSKLLVPLKNLSSLDSIWYRSIIKRSTFSLTWMCNSLMSSLKKEAQQKGNVPISPNSWENSHVHQWIYIYWHVGLLLCLWSTSLTTLFLFVTPSSTFLFMDKSLNHRPPDSYKS
jgi:hypothetical protein